MNGLLGKVQYWAAHPANAQHPNIDATGSKAAKAFGTTTAAFGGDC